MNAPPSKVPTLFMGLSRTSKRFSNLGQTVLLLRGAKMFQGEDAGYSVLGSLSLVVGKSCLRIEPLI